MACSLSSYQKNETYVACVLTITVFTLPFHIIGRAECSHLFKTRNYQNGLKTIKFKLSHTYFVVLDFYLDFDTVFFLFLA